jgi:hypothetical protein
MQDQLIYTCDDVLRMLDALLAGSCGLPVGTAGPQGRLRLIATTAQEALVCAWRQALAAYRQKSRISAGEVGPAISSWLSRMVTARVDAVTCAAVPVPPTQP